MEGIDCYGDGELRLPPGFRFHPTDEELITYYLARKVEDQSFRDRTITDVVDLNRYEPWELPGKAEMGEKEWYFYTLKDRKYPLGTRSNRTTKAGYWKSTGKHKEVFMSMRSTRPKKLVGLKKILVFHKGRAPKGLKTNWVMHEYRMVEGNQVTKLNGRKEWVVCRLFYKVGRKKVSLSELRGDGASHVTNDCSSVSLPPFTHFLTTAPAFVESHLYGHYTNPASYLSTIPIGATSATDVPFNFTDTPNMMMSPLADYVSLHTTSSSYDDTSLFSNSVYSWSSQCSDSTRSLPFLQNHGAPSPTLTSPSAQSYQQQSVQHEHFHLNDIAPVASCLTVDNNCTPDIPSGRNIALLLPCLPSDPRSLWFKNVSMFHA